MIMLPGRHYPDYHGNVYGYHSHVEAFIGIMSDKPLTDENFYDDDYIVHYNDNSFSTYFRSMQSLPGTYDDVNGSACPHSDDSSVMCLNPTYNKERYKCNEIDILFWRLPLAGGAE